MSKPGLLKTRRGSGSGFWFLIVFSFFVLGCNSEKAPDCFQVPGTIVKDEVKLEPFSQVVVYGKIKVLIMQGQEQEVLIEAGENLLKDISAKVEEGQLILRDLSTCNFFRTAYVPKIHITIPNLTFIENSGNQLIEGIGILRFPKITLRSNNYEKNPEVYTNGDFRFRLESRKIVVSGDDFANFYLSGKTGYLRANFWAGDGRLEAGELVADSVRVFHRGTNKMIVHPLEAIRGEIRSTGDVISVKRPPIVEVRSYYTGRLILQN